MKFLCVPCDQPMKLTTVRPPDRGSLSVVYSCSECGYEMAMLTNPYETQVVSSLGVKIAPAADAAAPNPPSTSGGEEPGARTSAVGTSAAGESNKEGGGKCPFAEMIPGLMGEGTDAGTAASAGTGARTSAAAPAWTEAAVARLEVIPSFVRPMARTGIERFARERGYATIDEKVLDEARLFFGM